MSSDQELADAVRAAAVNLREAVNAARAANLKVSVPPLLSHWIDTGTPPGELERWVITRNTL